MSVLFLASACHMPDVSLASALGLYVDLHVYCRVGPGSFQGGEGEGWRRGVLKFLGNGWGLGWFFWGPCGHEDLQLILQRGTLARAERRGTVGDLEQLRGAVGWVSRFHWLIATMPTVYGRV